MEHSITIKGFEMFQNAKIIFLVLVTLSIFGCGSSGPVKIGVDTYMISKTSIPQVSASSIQADLYAEANTFCESKGMELQPISEQGVEGITFVRESSAQIKFRCLKNGDSELSRPTMKPVANVRIESDVGEKKEVKEIPAQQSGDMYVELKKLKELLDSGVITQAEFDVQKKKILDK
jgi:hypothetical protein